MEFTCDGTVDEPICASIKTTELYEEVLEQSTIGNLLYWILAVRKYWTSS